MSPAVRLHVPPDGLGPNTIRTTSLEQRGVDADRGERRHHHRRRDARAAVDASDPAVNSRVRSSRAGRCRPRRAARCSARSLAPGMSGHRIDRLDVAAESLGRTRVHRLRGTAACSAVSVGQRPGIQVGMRHRDVAVFRVSRMPVSSGPLPRPVHHRGCARPKCPPRAAPTTPAQTRPGSSRRTPRLARLLARPVSVPRPRRPSRRQRMAPPSCDAVIAELVFKRHVHRAGDVAQLVLVAAVSVQPTANARRGSSAVHRRPGVGPIRLW